jgi:prepilin-type N-terminal cleavage/methylation domain-containing protein
MRKGFTLIELLVAMAVLALMIAFASIVFKVSIDTYRVSAATAEIMQKLRAVTDQLDADFKGLRKGAPLLIWFQLDDPNRYDQIMFFADGDFSSVQLYEDVVNGEPKTDGTNVVRGNVARVFYGQANVNTHDPGTEPRDPRGPNERRRILARRQHISDPCNTHVDKWPDLSMPNLNFSAQTTYNGKLYRNNERYEHDRLSLSQWQAVEGPEYDGSNEIIDICFNNRPQIDTGDPNTYHKLLCEGVGSFSIQWAYWDNLNGNNRFYWFPSKDPDGAEGPAQSHFLLRGKTAFGVYFNIPGNFTNSDWYAVGNIVYKSGNNFAAEFFPAVIKFTFRLYDSKGVIRDGMEFSHIVYLEQ